MIDKKLSQLKTLKSISLTDAEKGILRAAVARKIQMARPVSQEALWQLGVRHGLRIGLSTFLFMVFVTGSVSVVADNSLPGDPLYSFKVNVNEEIKGAFLTTPEEKLSWERRRIDNRLNEIKTLASTQTLTKAKQAKAQQALDTHLAKVSAELETLSDKQPEKALEVTAELEVNLKAKKEAIATIVAEKSQEEKDEAFKAVDASLKKVSDEEFKIVTKEIDKLATDIAEVSTATIAIEDEVSEEGTENAAAATMMKEDPKTPPLTPSEP